jgi:hypothetical protein
LTACGDRCVDTQLDRAHCGGCDQACPEEEVCSLGGCGLECVGGTTRCGDACVDAMVNPEHCGGCDKPCPTGTCDNGVCACSNGAHDGSESDVDCGGGVCAPCAEGKMCGDISDCMDGLRCVSGSCGIPLPPLDSALVGFWRFEGDAVDASDKGNDGVVVNAMPTAGKVGNAYQFTDGACVVVPDSDSLDMLGSSALTLLAWIRHDGGCTGDRGLLLNKESSYELGVECIDALLQDAVIVDANGWSWAGTAQVPIGAWQQIALSWDGTTVRHYLNGVQVFTRTSSGALLNQATGLGIGCRDVAADGGTATIGSFFVGAIDEVAIYSRALSAAEIENYYDLSK